jgi:dTDP-4-dehydrorhamnose 3,5-epimerase/CDP-3, 6-dideoxy-D-glycero-D-glycero-4-hexulose-5-epimerase
LPKAAYFAENKIRVIPSARVIDLPAFADNRGLFVKTFNDSLFRKMDIPFTVLESYFSVSAQDVIRGMHFQLPPHHHAKIVFCPKGSILDVALDLRRDSDTYGQCFSQVLSAENHKAFYIPEGFAHGFKALSPDALTYYLVSSEYNQAHDTGIAYDSIGFDWDVASPVLSDRDRGFVRLEDFNSPF